MPPQGFPENNSFGLGLAREEGVVEVLKNTSRALALLWEADPANTVILALLTLVRAALPVTQAWVAKLILDGIVAAIHNGLSPAEGVRVVLPYLSVELALVVISAAASQGYRLVHSFISMRLGNLVSNRVILKALSLEVKWFEDAEFYNKLQNARGQSDFRAMAIVTNGFMLIQNGLTLAAFFVPLVSFSPGIALMLCAASIPLFLVQTHYGRLDFRLKTWRVPEMRQMNYLEYLLTVDAAVKEIKLFNLGQPLLKVYNAIFRKTFREDAELVRARSIKGLLWGSLATISFYCAYVWIVYQAVGGAITLGSMTFYLALFSRSQGVSQGILDNISGLYENGLFLTSLFGFLDLDSQKTIGHAPHSLVEDSTRGIEFENVWFRYPGAEKWALQDLSFSVRPGEKVALVGENGAGKTTLIKLLARFYEPAKGRILYRGIDLREFPLDELQRRIGAIFQDPVRYQLSLRENIGFGAIEKVDDVAAVEAAALMAGADRVMNSLPQGLNSRLGRWFSDGQELSGGQWQRVALGRAFMRDSEMLILDEPSSMLDAEAENDIFLRVQQLSAGKTALIVSHRFSTVRMADRILVLKDGRVEETGTHSDLIERAGTYARLFELQARGYQ